MLRFANTIPYYNEYDLYDCLRPRAPFGFESFDLEALDRLMAEGRPKGSLGSAEPFGLEL